MESEVEEFLEHHGVKGMKWGIRKQEFQNFRQIQKRRKLNKYGDPKVAKLTAAQKRARKARNVDRAIFGTRMAIGMAFTAASLAAAKGPSSSAYANVNLGGKRTVMSPKDIINKERNVKVSALSKTLREGHIDRSQFEKFREILNARYDRKLVEAL